MSAIKTRVISDLQEFEALAGTWDRLLQESSEDSSIYLTHEWLSTWWRHFGAGRKLNVVLVEDGDRVVGAVPLMRTQHRLGCFRLATLETIGAVNCNRLGIVSRERRGDVAGELLTYLEGELAQGGLSARLSLVPDDSKLLAELRRLAPSWGRKLAFDERVKTVAPYLALPSTWEAYLASLSANARHELRRQLRSLERDHSVEYGTCSADDLEERLDMLVELHQARWKAAGVSGLFSDPRMKPFYRDLARLFLARNWLHFSYLKVDGEMAAGEFSYVFNGTFYCATSARDLRFARRSLGHLHHMLFLRDAINMGLTELDLQKGDEPYKFRWAKTARRYLDVLAVGGTRFPRARIMLLRLFLRLCEAGNYSLREIYHIYRIRRRERRERVAMGLEDQSARRSRSRP